MNAAPGTGAESFAKSIISMATVSDVSPTGTILASIDATLMGLAEVQPGELVDVYSHLTGSVHRFVAMPARPGSGIIKLPRAAGFSKGESIDILAVCGAPQPIAVIECDEDNNRMISFDEVDLVERMREMMSDAYVE